MRHSDALYARVILPRVGEPAVAEDVLRATLATAIEKLPAFQWRGTSLYFWLRRIAVNKIVDHHRRDQRTAQLARRLSAEPELPVGGRTGPDPEAALIAAQERRLNLDRVGDALAELNPRYRQALELRLLQERSRKECAEELGVTVGTFDVLLFRAVRAFRRVYGMAS